MTPHKQLIKHDPENGRYGDCYRTCIAAILDCPPQHVPHAWSDKGEWVPAGIREFLASQGIKSFSIGWLAGDGVELKNILALTVGPNEGMPVILSGTSSIGVNHAVVAMNGAIVCDPSGNGIVGPCGDGYYNIELLVVGDEWRDRIRRLERQIAEDVG